MWFGMVGWGRGMAVRGRERVGVGECVVEIGVGEVGGGEGGGGVGMRGKGMGVRRGWGGGWGGGGMWWGVGM